MRLFQICLLLSAASFAAVAITNEDIIRMVQQGIAPATILASIKGAETSAFHITPEEQPALLAAGVSPAIIEAMVRRVMLDEGRSNVRGENEKPREQAPVARVREVSRAVAWPIRTGHPELSGQIGGGTFLNRKLGVTNYWTAGAGIAFGVARYAALVGEYSYSRYTGSVLFGLIHASTSTQDVIGGVKFSAPTRISPYLLLGGGAARAFGESGAAFAVGGGFDFNVRPGRGIRLDERIIFTQSLWYERSSAGFYVRF
jgi:hypothetical protein